MEKGKKGVLYVFMLMAFGLLLGPLQATAAQTENAADCDEGVIAEPVAMAYGDHSAGCAISPATDLDRFSFSGLAGDQVRINVLSGSNGFDPELEIRDPLGTVIVNGAPDGAACSSSFTCSFTLELNLPLSGNYSLALSDTGNNEAGNYTIQLEKILPAPISPRLDYDVSMSDSISPGTDVDHYNFNATAGTSIRLNVLSTSNRFDPVIEIRDPNGVIVVNGTDDGAACSSSFTCSFSVDLSPVISGTYSVVLYDGGTNETGGYQISLWCVVGPCDSDGDGIPDPDAPAISYDTPLDDSVTPAVDGDFFTFNATAGTDIRFNVLSTSNGFDPVIEIRDPNGVIVVNGTDDGAACSSSFTCSFSVDLSPVVSGPYTVALYDSGTNETGGYQISLWCVVGPCDSDADGNPDPDAPVMSYITPVIDALAPAVDGDFFSFNATAGTDIRLNVLSTSNGLDPAVEIRDPNGAPVVNGVDDGATCTSSFTCSFSIDLSPAVSGTYSVLLYDNGTNEAGGYQMSLWCLNGDCDSDADGFMDADRELVDYGETIIKALSPAVDGDFFIFNGTAGDDTRINVLSTSNGLDPMIEIRDPNGIVVVNGAADGAACSSSFTCSFSIDFSPATSGTYSVVLYDSATNEAGGYQISLQCLFGSCTDLTPPLICGDNCSEVPNPEQTDADADGFGNVCDTDFNNDNQTDFADLAFMKSVFFTTNAIADLDGDGRVDFADLAILKSRFFAPPGPSCVAPNLP